MDRDYILDDPEDNPRDLLDCLISGFDALHYKLLACVFVLFMFINSDIFIGRILANFEGAAVMKTPTNWGTILQGIFLVVGVLIADALIQQKII